MTKVMAIKKTTNLAEKKEAMVKEVSDEIVQSGAREVLKRYTQITCEPKAIFRDLTKELPGHISEHAEKSGAVTHRMEEGLMALGLETHYPLAEITSEKYRPLILEFARGLEKEYDCKTPSDRALVEVAAGSYIRYLEYSKRFNNCMRLDYISHEKNGYFGMLSKEVDRAQRQFVTALTLLKQLKNPPLEISISAKTAFVAGNQQINTAVVGTGADQAIDSNDFGKTNG